MSEAGILNDFNATLDLWIHFLNDYSYEEICRKPETGSWSIGQMYQHMIDDTSWFVEQMRVCFADSKHHDQEMHLDAKKMFKENQFPNIKIAGPATNKFIPDPPGIDFLRDELMQIKERVNTLNEAFGFAHAKGKTKHPGLLFFDAAEWLQFADMHLRHHLRQKKRIDERLGFSRRFEKG